MSGLGILIAIVVVALIAVGAYYSHLQQQQRRQELSTLADQLGWRFDPGKDYSHDDRFSQFDQFRKGHSRYAYNTLSGVLQLGNRACPAQLGDYHYQITTNNGKSSSTRTYRFSYALIQTPYLASPSLRIRTEGYFDKFAGLLGFDDIDFESAEFSDRFHVKSSDKRFAYDVVHPRMMEFLLAESPPTLEIERGYLCLHRGNRCWTTADIRDCLDWTERFFALWPAHVVNSLEG